MNYSIQALQKAIVKKMDKRIAYIQIQTPSGDKEIRNIGMKFRINRKMSETGSDARISIANLAREDIEYLTTYMSPYVDQSKRKKINVFAGYESTGVGLIFSGDIYSALPNGLPDTWLNIEARTNYYNQQNIISYSTTAATTKQIAENYAAQSGLQLVWNSTSQKVIDSFNYSGAKAKMLTALNKMDDFIIFIDNGLLKVMDKISEPPAQGEPAIHSTLSPSTQTRADVSTTKKTGYVKYINQNSGLVGLPQPDEYGVKFKVLLDPAINLGDWIYLESKRLPIVNGYYQVYELTYDGATREPQFYCEIYGKNKRV